VRQNDHQEFLSVPTSRKFSEKGNLQKLVPLTVVLCLGLTSCGGGGGYGGGGGGGVTPDPPRATNMTVSPPTLALTFLGEVTRLTPSVRDQNGQAFNTTVTWSAADPSVATVSASGTCLEFQLEEPIATDRVAEAAHHVLHALGKIMWDPPVVVDDAHLTGESGHGVCNLVRQRGTPRAGPHPLHRVEEVADRWNGSHRPGPDMQTKGEKRGTFPCPGSGRHVVAVDLKA